MSEARSEYPRFRDPKENNPPPKRKKNAPDRPQPAWLFPPDKDNPILNPKPKDDEKLQKEATEREKSLDYMKRRVHAVPDRPEPPPQLLTLVGAFLTEYGFNSTSRLFTNERKARQTLNGWEDALGKRVERGLPSLEKIYRDFYKNWQITKADETSSSSSDDDNSNTSSEATQITNNTDDEEISSGRDSASHGSKGKRKSKTAPSKAKPSPSTSSNSTSDSEEGGLEKMKIKRNKKAQVSSLSFNSSSSSSDSDADDEEEPTTVKAKTNPAVQGKASRLKRKASSSSSDTSTSSQSSEDERPATKKTKIAMSAADSIGNLPQGPQVTEYIRSTKESSSSSVSSSSESDTPSPLQKRPASNPVSINPVHKTKSSSLIRSSNSDTSSSTSKAGVELQVPTTANARNPSTESASSATISGDANRETGSSTSSSTSATSGPRSDDEPTNKKTKSFGSGKAQKRKGVQPTPLAAAAQSAAALGETHPSNAYVPYDYADRAYNDLSVTRGKNFTKEKNKKKRGSYRGGLIDTAGGKGFKFTD